VLTHAKGLEEGRGGGVVVAHPCVIALGSERPPWSIHKNQNKESSDNTHTHTHTHTHART